MCLLKLCSDAAVGLWNDSFWQQSRGNSWHHTERSPPLLHYVYISLLDSFVDEKSFIDIILCIVLPRGKFGQPPCHIMWLKHLGVIAAPLRVRCIQETIWRPSHLDALGCASQACCRCCQNTQLWVESHSSEHWVRLYKSKYPSKRQHPSKRQCLFMWVK